jgi:hydrogenase maturation protease
MKQILVLGIGSRLMMDDGIGVYVIEELKKRNANPGIRYVVGETDIYFCLNQIKEATCIIVVDAVRLDNEPGSISTIPLQQALENSVQLTSTHDSHLLNEIKMQGKSIEGLIIGIEPYEIKFCPSLSSILQAQFFEVVGEIENIIISYLI